MSPHWYIFKNSINNHKFIILETDFLRLVQSVVYKINNAILFKDTKNEQLNILYLYISVDQFKIIDIQRIKNLEVLIKKLQKEIERL
ncbi:replication/maintenance protein RepL [Clostridium perfringens]|nr:replication/maintenance protein RepL [Clostridium perfringens]